MGSHGQRPLVASIRQELPFSNRVTYYLYCEFESPRIIVSKCFDFISSVFRYPGAQSLLSKSSLARRTLSAASSERSGLTRAKSHEPAGMAITAIIHQCDAQRHLLGLESKAHRFLCLIF